MIQVVDDSEPWPSGVETLDDEIFSTRVKSVRRTSLGRSSRYHVEERARIEASSIDVRKKEVSDPQKAVARSMIAFYSRQSRHLRGQLPE